MVSGFTGFMVSSGGQGRLRNILQQRVLYSVLVFIQEILNEYHVLSAVLGAGVISVNRIDKNPCSHRRILVERAENKQNKQTV